MAPACGPELADPAAPVRGSLLGHACQVKRRSRQPRGRRGSAQRSGMVYRRLVALAEPGGNRGSVELARDDQHLPWSAEGIGVSSEPFERFGSVTDEVPVRGYPHVARPAAMAQPSRADGATAGGVRLVLDEELAPSVGDRLDMPARQRRRQRRARPCGHVLNRRQAIQHCTPHPTIHRSASLSAPPTIPRARLSRLTTRPNCRHAAVHCLPEVARELKDPSPCCRAGRP
jgi:hypothetical protein